MGIDQMTGPTIATIPLRVRLDRDSTVAEALRQEQNHSAQLLPYEQIGLQQVRRLSNEAAAACDFQNLLVIQPRREEQTRDLFTKAGVTAKEGAFTTYALTLLCELAPGSVTVEATACNAGDSPPSRLPSPADKQPQRRRPRTTAAVEWSGADTGGAVRARPDRGAVPRAAGRARRVRVGR
ncbi:hypothetical protein CNMCM8980_008651 [Aspergillus fumigatiaffinis]|nr:hypothetical protein CNMCM8980_008651 [Aspergillus fumigatiaffinis]